MLESPCLATVCYRSGPWMAHVKTAFGFVILNVTGLLLERIIGGLGVYVFCGRCWASLSLVGPLSPAFRPDERGCVSYRLSCWRQRSLACGLTTGLGVRIAIRASSAPQFHGYFCRGRTQSGAGAESKPVMLDFYADWCVACKEFEKYTFSDRGSSRRSATRCSCRLTSPLIMHRMSRC